MIDIDLKGNKTYKSVSERLLDVFKGYYTVKTPNGGYHIYLKVRSKKKFKSQHLFTLVGERTTVEILGEKKKVMGSGSLINGVIKMTKNMWENSLSTMFISRDTLISKLKEAGLSEWISTYVEKESVGERLNISRAISPLHGSKTGDNLSKNKRKKKLNVGDVM